MAKFIVLVTALVALVMLDTPLIQKKGLIPAKGVKITIQGKHVPDGVYIRRLGKDYIKATAKNNVINIEGSGEIGVLVGFGQLTAVRIPCNESDSKSDTVDTDNDNVDNRYDACPCDSGSASLDPTRNGCPPGMSGTPPDTTVIVID